MDTRLLDVYFINHGININRDHRNFCFNFRCYNRCSKFLSCRFRLYLTDHVSFQTSTKSNVSHFESDIVNSTLQMATHSYFVTRSHTSHTTTRLLQLRHNTEKEAHFSGRVMIARQFQMLQKSSLISNPDLLPATTERGLCFPNSNDYSSNVLLERYHLSKRDSLCKFQKLNIV